MIVSPFRNDLIHLGHIAISQENIAGLRPDGAHMVDPVLFLLGAGELMLFNHIVKIVFHR